MFRIVFNPFQDDFLEISEFKDNHASKMIFLGL